MSQPRRAMRIVVLAAAVPVALLPPAPAGAAGRAADLPAAVPPGLIPVAAGGLIPAAAVGVPPGLFGVSCPAVTRCLAVGSRAVTGTSTRAAALEWSAGRWRSWRVPVPNRARSSYLNEVSCANRDSCVAVGSSVSPADAAAALAETWNGRRWRLTTSAIPAAARASDLLDVSCASAANCIAVGDVTLRSGASRPFAEHWNGTGWRRLTTPEPAGTASAVLDGIACRAARCLAVGFAQNSPDPFQAAGLAEEWTGRGWHILAFSDPGGATLVDAQDVSCPPGAAGESAGPCIAVGFWQSPGERPRSLAERWRGGRWQLLKPPPRGPAAVQLDGVSCPVATRCVAVGMRLAATKTGRVLAGQAWNGTGWRTMRFAAPRPGTASFLNQVSCPARSRCLAVGGQGSGRYAAALAESWNGTGWQELPVPGGRTRPAAMASSEHERRIP